MGATNEWITTLAVGGEDVPFTSEERTLIVDWQFKRGGGFYTKLLDAMCQADSGNLAKFERGFPEIYAAFREWKSGKLSRRLREWSENQVSI